MQNYEAQKAATRKYDVVSVCNALVDILFEANNQDLHQHGLTKGTMHLVDRQTLDAILSDFLGKQKAEELGGSALNAMRTLTQLEKKTCFAGMIADDHFGNKIRTRLAELNIAGHLHLTSEEATGLCIVLVTPDGERTMVTYLGASRLYNSEHLPRKELTEAAYFHFCGYQWDTDGQKSAMQEALSIAKNANTRISFDLADPFVVQHHNEQFKTIIKDYADIVFANKEEARLLWGTDPVTTAETIAALGATAIIKLGSEGALIQHGNERIHIKAVSTQVVDTTAAGDMFAAGFLYGLTSAKPLAQCGQIAATLASDVISRFGATLSANVLHAVRSQ